MGTDVPDAARDADLGDVVTLEDADAASQVPSITVTPVSLDFEAPLLREAVTLELTIGNEGTSELQVSAIVVEVADTDSPKEVTTDPEGELGSPLVIAPGASIIVPVTLLAEDARPDSGQIRIESNDPETPTVLVPYVSRHDGEPALEVCVLDEAPWAPQPFEDCAVDEAEGQPVIDFVQVELNTDATRLVYGRNLAVGNAPLEISGLYVSNEEGGSVLFTVETFFMLETTPGEDATEVLVSPPLALRAALPEAQVEADVLHVRLVFHADEDGLVPPEFLVIETNDATGTRRIPLLGVVTGCPPGFWDVNGDPADGCEYPCVLSNGGVERCDGVDNNCDGDTDEEDAQNCVVYYKDGDQDSYGVDNDYRCLCARDMVNSYTATRGGDCNDDDPNVRPLVQEQCSTDWDDNCNGDTNDRNAAGCSWFYRDGDDDGYGVTSDVRCHCEPEGIYRATVGGDCDDTNPLANPGMIFEDCNTPFDDNCSGTNNDENALNCLTFFVDVDGDGYGATHLSKCYCEASGFYRALQSGDCNDNNAAVHPGAVEICNYVDDNCDGVVDEGFNLLNDVENCGSCGTRCTNAHGTTSCVNGSCRPVCASGWGDCNGDPRDGCETDLGTVSTCGSCSGDASCPPGFFCELGVCRAALPPGEPCNRTAQCQSGFCVDGVCCNTGCTGRCRACNLPGQEGTCAFHSVSTDPEGDCTMTAQATCAENGLCDGAGGCALWATGTVCVPQSCSGSTYNPADTCDGSGTCVDNGTQSCSPYVCDGPVCRTSCISDSHCITGSFCSVGVCITKKDNGVPCVVHGECTSGNCVNGVCCDTACTGLCRACNLPSFEGTCMDRPLGTDPLGRCPPCYWCNGAGACVPATAGTDIKENCPGTPESGCGTDGFCNGSGECRLWPSSTVCQAQSCSGSTKYIADMCNGSGTCIDGGSLDCSPYRCDSAGFDCRTSCTSSVECVDGAYCDAGVCVGKKGLGQTCSNGEDCLSDNCVDEVCCNGPCGGTCQACNLTGTVGTCTNVPSNTDPDGECTGLCRSCNGAGACGLTVAGVDNEGECALTAPSTCGQDGFCDGTGSCRLWASGTECVAQTCTGYTRYLADTCDGSGTCQDQGTASCEPFVCNGVGTDCRSECSMDSHCTESGFCLGTTCVFKMTIGQVCTGANQCQSGFCVDGFCCEGDCTDNCRSCGVSGAEGVCINHTVGTDPEGGCGLCRICDGLGVCTVAQPGSDPKDQCPQDSQASCNRDGTCNGAGACRLWASGTVCQAQTCEVSTKYLADTCNGTGACIDNGAVSCAPYLCDAGNDCRTSCANDAHCIPGSYCDGGVCHGKKAPGTPCGAGNECISGHCVDGVCCNSDCAGECRACNLMGNLGSCTAHALGTDPEGECAPCQICNGGGLCVFAASGSDPKSDCAAQAESTCGQDGSCDGSGLCRLWAAGTICEAAACTGAIFYPADTCNGVGSCVDSGTVSCDPYACVGAACGTTCTLHTHCASGYYCSGSNVCVAKKALGQSCGGTVECTSGFCADGVCCDGACTGACRACNLVGSTGFCTLHGSGTDPEAECGLCRVCDSGGQCAVAAAGTDPKNQCPLQSQASCGLDGQCNGSGACRYWSASTVCVAESCSAATYNPADLCDGAGTCVDSGSQSCSPYDCLGSVCRTGCSLDAHCLAGYYCTGGLCVSKKPIGETCSGASQCMSGYCTDGVCCNNDCAGACRACDQAGSVGTCTFHAAATDPESNCPLCQVCNGAGNCVSATAGTDPKNQCTESSVFTCGLDGWCDGSSACRYWSSGTECEAASCVGSTFYPADMCSGSGTCVDSGSQSCSPYRCDAGGLVCMTSCTLSLHCVAGFYCLGNACVPESVQGTPCTLDSQCVTGLCRDGYCCDSGCTGDCQACNRPGLEGTCSFFDSGTDPELECGLCGVCNGSGVCIFALGGTDPKEQCVADPQSSCDQTGSCNGAGSCALWPSGTLCLAQSCTGSTLTLADTCDGGGICVDNGTTSCSPYVCSGSQCGTSCSLDSHCLTGYYCSGGVCLPKLTGGTACGGSNQCQSDFCVDGVCCNNDCAGLCRACDLAGSVGTCTFITAGTDPTGECGLCQVCSGLGACTAAASGTDPKGQCTESAQSTCGLNGFCDGVNACAFWPSGTVCLAQSCTGTTQHHADLCNGLGSCVDQGTLDCTPYRCSGTQCATSCSVDDNCATGYYCAGGLCIVKKTLGSFCSAGNQCQGGFCIDGVCCNNDCVGPCRACNLAGNEGTCTLHPVNTDPEANCGHCQACSSSGTCVPATGGTDPKNQCAWQTPASCGQDGTCNGSGACRLWPAGTVCTSLVCSGSILYYADLCDGGGTCVDGGMLGCDPYMCNGTQTDCRTSCTLNSHCVTGHTCSGGVCVAAGGKANGEACLEGGECASGHCTDGVCCNQACGGLCMACNVAGSLGMCTAFSAGTDPEWECPSCQTCSGFGSCVNASAGTDPKGDCTPSAPETCGTDGYCNGSGGCRLHPAGTVCVAETCTGTTHHLADTCNGTGTCVDSGTQSCVPYVCSGSQCGTSCITDGDCAAGYNCSGGFCVFCGNGIVEAGEECDTNNLNGESCASLGYDYGTLTCNANCTFNASGCEMATCTLYNGFEGAQFPPPNWERIQFHPTNTWFRSSGGQTGSYRAQVSWHVSQQDEMLISHPVKCSNMTINFQHACNQNWIQNYEVALWVVVGAWDGGTGDDYLITPTLCADGFAAGCGSNPAKFIWCLRSIPIPTQFNGQPIRIAWEYYGADGDSYLLDEVLLVN